MLGCLSGRLQKATSHEHIPYAELIAYNLGVEVDRIKLFLSIDSKLNVAHFLHILPLLSLTQEKEFRSFNANHKTGKCGSNSMYN